VPSKAKLVTTAEETPVGTTLSGRKAHPSVPDSKVQTPHAGALLVLQLNVFLSQMY
jgi:hypothetical protein